MDCPSSAYSVGFSASCATSATAISRVSSMMLRLLVWCARGASRGLIGGGVRSRHTKRIDTASERALTHAQSTKYALAHGRAHIHTHRRTNTHLTLMRKSSSLAFPCSSLRLRKNARLTSSELTCMARICQCTCTQDCEWVSVRPAAEPLSALSIRSHKCVERPTVFHD